MRVLRWLAAPFAVLLLLVVTGMALAADPPTLTETVYDQTGRLSDGKGDIAVAVAQLKSDHDVTMYVVFMNSLDGEDPGAFIDRLAVANSLASGKNVVFLVSLTERKDSVWASNRTSISSDELTAMRTGQIEPRLKAGDFVGSVTTAAREFGLADAGTVAPPVTPPQAPAQSIDMSGFWSLLGVLLGTVIVASLILVAASYVARVVRRRREAQREAEEMEKLGRDARLAIVAADDEVRTAAQELDFAVAQYGEDEMAPYRTGLSSAKSELQEAFKVGQEIDDDVPDTLAQRREMLEDVTASAGRIRNALAKQTEAIETLQDLEKTAAATLAKMQQEAPKRAAAVKDAQGVLDAIAAHGQSALHAVANNIDVAVAQYKVGDGLLGEAQQAIDNGKQPVAALRLREAGKAFGKAQGSLSDVAKVGNSLDEAQRNLDAEIRSATAEIANAAEAIKTGSVSGLSDELAAAKDRLAASRHEAESADVDFLVAYKKAVEANGIADQILGTIRDIEEQRRRALEAAQAQVRTAAASIAQADSYINNHSYISRSARNRLSEARRQMEEAQRHNDVFDAATIAVLASQAADEAYASARHEVQSHDDDLYSGSSSSRSSSGSYDSGSSSGGFDFGSSSSGSFGGGGSGGSSSSGGW